MKRRTFLLTGTATGLAGGFGGSLVAGTPVLDTAAEPDCMEMLFDAFQKHFRETHSFCEMVCSGSLDHLSDETENQMMADFCDAEEIALCRMIDADAQTPFDAALLLRASWMSYGADYFIDPKLAKAIAKATVTLERCVGLPDYPPMLRYKIVPAEYLATEGFLT